MIILGMYLATITILKSGVALPLSVPTIYGQQSFVTNDQLWDGTAVVDPATSGPRITAFMTDNVLSQGQPADYAPLT
jgi:hypothetical protein